MNKKAWIAMLLAVLMLFSMISCDGGPEETTGDEKETMNDNEDFVAPDEVGNGKHVMTFVMGHEQNSTTSSKWREWNNTGESTAHLPDKTDANGLRDIASVYYPSIGLYDVTDPDYQEYMMQLCKMCYVDTVNYYVTLNDITAGKTDWGRSFDSLTVEMLRKYGLSSSARLATFPEDYETEAGNALTTLIEKLDDTILTIDGRPVLAQFTMRDMTTEQVAAWKEAYAASHDGVEPFLMTWQHGMYKQSSWLAVSDGQYGWIELDDSSVQKFWKNGIFKSYADLETAKTNHDGTVEIAKNYINQGLVDFYAEAVTPGFDSTGCWGWGEGPSKVESGENGELYEYKWQSAVENGFPMVMIPTWDDWGEASTIEPSLQYGIDYLEITRKYAAEYKEIEANTASLELPGWIYKIRKTTKDADILAAMDVASQLIADCRYDEAEEIVKPYVETTGIPATSKEFFNYPTTMTSPLVPPVMESDNKPTVEGDTETWKAIADTYVTISSTGIMDAGTESKMMVKKLDSDSLTRRSYIKFDTTETTLAGVSKATLRIYCTGAPSTMSDRIDVNLYAVNADWEELSFNWDTQPTVLQKIADVDMSSCKSDRWFEIDVTAYVQAHLGAPISFALWSEGSDDASTTLQFSTREIRRKEPQLILVAGDPSEGGDVEPSFSATLVSVADTYVQQNSSEDFGTAAMLRVKRDDAKSLTRISFIKFDTSSVEIDSVNKATLRLYCLFASEAKSEIENRDYKLYAVSSEWEETGMTWASKPEQGEKIADIDTKSAKKGVWLEVDVTNYVNTYMGETIAFMICNEGVASNENHINFGSREVADQEPQLIIE